MDKKSVILATMILCSLFFGQLTWGEEVPQPKSEVVATLLGIDPFPGDALFYAGKPLQGSLNILLAAPGAVSMTFGFLARYVICEHGCSATAWTAVGVGAAIYSGALVWDAIGGISGVREYNRKLNASHSLLQHLHPAIVPTQDGLSLAMGIDF